MKRDVAKKVVQTAFSSSDELGALVRFLKTNSDDNLEYQEFGKRIARVIAYINEELTKPVSALHPGLEKDVQDEFKKKPLT